MALRFFGSGFNRHRSCPACEEKIAADASFCPSCFMVFRPEGAAALREHLQGGRIPGDVYLLRKLQAADPDAGPVERRPAADLSVPPVAAEPESVPAVFDEPTEPLVIPDPLALFQDDPEPAEIAVPPESIEAEDPSPELELPLDPPAKTPPEIRTGLESLFRFGSPLPPPARTAREIPGLLAWLLEHDPVIPNNLSRLDAIHAEVFDDRPACRLSYTQHLELQIADDLWLHTDREALEAHLQRLVGAYRQATEAYHGAAAAERTADALWRMSSAVSRIRAEAWVHRTLYGAAPGRAFSGRRRRATRPDR